MNKRLKTMLIICVSMCFSVNNLFAQESWENVVNELEELKEHPIPINHATKEQLERIPFLSEHLVENILYYLYKYGPMLSDKELMMVEGMDTQTARWLKEFITFQFTEKEKDKPTLKNVFKYGKHE